MTDALAIDTPHVAVADAQLVIPVPKNIPEFLGIIVGDDVAWEPAAIPREKGAPIVRSFPPGPKRAADILTWCAKKNETLGVYLHFARMNKAIGDTDKDKWAKASEVDVAGVWVLVVDLDLEPGMPFDEARAKLDALVLRKGAWPNMPHPSILVDSGGGYQLIWLLAERFMVDGNIEEIKCRGRGLHKMLRETKVGKVDYTFSLDHLFRMPFTMNFAKASKLTDNPGRQDRMATIVESEWHPERRYLLSDLPAVDECDTDGGVDVGDKEVPINEAEVKVGWLTSLDPLNDKVARHVRLSIEHGNNLGVLHEHHLNIGHRVSESKFSSHSNLLVSVAGGLDEAGYTPEEIAGICRDENWGAGYKHLQKLGSAQNRAVGRALGAARALRNKRAAGGGMGGDKADLIKMNTKHFAVLNHGNKFRVGSWKKMDNERLAICLQGTDDFRNAYMNIQKIVTDFRGIPKQVSLGEWWLQHRERRQYEDIVFRPGEEGNVDGNMNLWQGFTCDPKPGSCKPYIDHLRENICAGNEEYFEYLLNWMARAVQFPAKVGEVAVVLQGKRGVGKGVAISQFGGLFGRHFLPVYNAKHLIGNFNAHFHDCCVLFADEAFYAGDKQHESILKGLITERDLTVEKKGVDVFKATSHIHLMMSSNDKWQVPAGEAERRFFCLHVADTKIQDNNYFQPIVDFMEKGDGRAELLYVLQHIDLSKFVVQKVPQTEMLAEQKQLTRKGIDAVIEHICHFRRIPNAEAFGGADVAITTREKKGEGFWCWIRDNFPDLKNRSAVSMSHELKKRWGCSKPAVKWEFETGIRFLQRAELCALFDKQCDVQEWEDPDEDWIAPIDWQAAQSQKDAAIARTLNDAGDAASVLQGEIFAGRR